MYRCLEATEEFGARCIVILEGPPHPLKAAKLRERAAGRERTGIPALAPQDYEPALALLRALGIPIVQAPHDAEAQGAWMTQNGYADVLATTDWDALAMGAGALLRGFSGRAAAPKGQTSWTYVPGRRALHELDADRETLAVAAVLMGCDYFDGFKGIGPAKALKLARKNRRVLDLEAKPRHLAACLDELDASNEERHEAHAALDYLLEPPHVDPGVITWRRPDLEDLDARLRVHGAEVTNALRARLARTAIVHEHRSVPA